VKRLIVTALAAEAQSVPSSERVLVTGPGKVQAAAKLAVYLADWSEYTQVVVLGTAGLLTREYPIETVYQVGAAVQHDVGSTSHLAFLNSVAGSEVTAPGLVQWDDDAPFTVATGDVFVQSASRARELAIEAELVDMETYSYAYVCAYFGVPLKVFKYATDYADSKAQVDWTKRLRLASEALWEAVSGA
jgi:adenosylhomocysteine nucleosidase